MSERVAGTVVGKSRSERFHDVEARIRRVTYVLDEVVPIPGTGQKIGVDPVVGLIPVVGDAVGALVGSWIILEAARFGIPRLALARMVVNLLVDLAIGAIPLIGDLFDIVSRSNSANLAIFRRHALDPDASTAGHRMFFVGLVLMLVGAIWIIATIMARVFEAFWRAVLG
jgi:hypothetical protein